MKDWPVVRLSEVCDPIVDCVNRTAPLSSEPTPYKMIRTSNVHDGFIDTDDVRYVDEPTFHRWTRRAVPVPGDVVLTREAPLGEVGMIRNAEHVFLGQRTIMYRAIPEKLDANFLLYSMLGRFVQGQIRGYGSGATVEHMRLPDCFNLKILLPPLDIQHKIASILSGYDELIANNLRRIKVLETMARRLFQEWFVNFRYPGHTAESIERTSSGPKPKDWTWCAASEALIINPRLQVNRSDLRPFVPMTSVSETGMHIEPVESRVTTSGSRFENGDTLFARITPCLENGKTAYVHCLEPEQVASGSTEFIVLRSELLGPEYTYLLARSDRFRDHAMKSMSGATGRQRVSEACFDRLFLPVPPPELLSTFTQQVRPMFEMSKRLFDGIDVLRRTRKLLLPRLLSGEIDVNGMSIVIAEEAA